MAVEGFQGWGGGFSMYSVFLGLALVFEQNNPEENFHGVNLVK